MRANANDMDDARRLAVDTAKMLYRLDINRPDDPAYDLSPEANIRSQVSSDLEKHAANIGCEFDVVAALLGIFE